MKFKSLHERKEQFRKFEKQWLNESFNVDETKEWLDEMGVENYTINDDGTVDVDGDVHLHDKGLNEIPIQFGVVYGSFDCSYNNLTSLKGSPKEVGGWFYCSDNPLKSVKGLSSSIKGNLIIKNTDLSQNELNRISEISSISGRIYSSQKEIKNNKKESVKYIPGTYEVMFLDWDRENLYPTKKRIHPKNLIDVYKKAVLITWDYNLNDPEAEAEFFEDKEGDFNSVSWWIDYISNYMEDKPILYIKLPNGKYLYKRDDIDNYV